VGASAFDDLDRQLDHARTLGHEYLTVASFPADRRRTLDDVARRGRGYLATLEFRRLPPPRLSTPAVMRARFSHEVAPVHQGTDTDPATGGR
jgi:hypothetical protein